jgi:hypothetical protein
MVSVIVSVEHRYEEGKTMAEPMLRLRTVAPDELLPEEVVLKKDPENPFLGPGDRSEPYRTYYIAHARMAPVFQKEHVHSPLLVDTPRGRGLLWRLWRTEVGIVLTRPLREGLALEESVTFLRGEEAQKISFVLDQIVLNPPNWG